MPSCLVRDTMFRSDRCEPLVLWQPEAVMFYITRHCFGLDDLRAEIVTNVLIWLGAFDNSAPQDLFAIPSKKAGSHFMLTK